MLEGNPNYTHVRIEEVLTPIAPWPKGEWLLKGISSHSLIGFLDMSETERVLAELMQENHLRLWPAFKAVLLRDGTLSEELVNGLVEVSSFQTSPRGGSSQNNLQKVWDEGAPGTASSSSRVFEMGLCHGSP